MAALTRNKDFKRLVRARASALGERYTVARAALLRHGKEKGLIEVTCEVTYKQLTEDEQRVFAEKRAAAQAKADAEHPDLAVRVAGPGEEEMQPILVLHESGGERTLPIWVGPVEAAAVSLAQQGIETGRPMTHDLLNDVVAAMGEAREIRITEVRDSTFFAELVVADTTGAERTVSCRPSDGIALAVRAGISILVAESLFSTDNVPA